MLTQIIDSRNGELVAVYSSYAAAVDAAVERGILGIVIFKEIRR